MRTVIHTERLTLRDPRAGDASRIEALASEWDVARMLGTMPYPYPENGAGSWIERMEQGRAAGDGYAFIIEQQGRLFGVIGLGVRDDGTVELGYWLGRPYWGQGFATEAAWATVGAFFEDTGAEGLACDNFVDNPASARVIRKCGFRDTGLARRWCEARQSDVLSRTHWLSRADWQGLTQRTSVAS